MLCLPLLLLGQNGLDQSFGSQGKKAFFLTTPTQNNVYYILTAHADSFQRITLVSRTFDDNGSKIILSRRLEWGALDTTFGKSGFISIPINDSNDFYYDISTIDPQGRIVFAGILF